MQGGLTAFFSGGYKLCLFVYVQKAGIYHSVFFGDMDCCVLTDITRNPRELVPSVMFYITANRVYGEYKCYYPNLEACYILLTL